ncbi:hypothetical protein BN1013_00773 [Candidatus Rubidus massiliensis]|nr:MAG: hypothetical protein BGO10_08410 [Chlamydia sp. 32-24]CDZ80266.1 hypothetical protein BN1013_00773 [Candidatus Rubidus massiliensis]
MKIKTKGKCIKCGEVCNSTQAKNHLLGCITQSASEGYLVRVAWAEQPNLYWMFIALSKDISLGKLDQFLRDIWLECCGHLSQFTIGNRRYMSHNESGSPSQSMKNKVGQLFLPGLKFDYTYDMGSSTELELEVIENISTPSQNKISLLMRNDPPIFPCKSCKKTSEIICSLCGDTICTSCSENHSCAVKEEDTYMLMPLVNSPRAGVCGYEGNNSND